MLLNIILYSLKCPFPCAVAEDVAILTSTMSFDAHVLQMYPPLLVGASLVLATPKGHLDPPYIARLMVEHQINEFIISVPTMVSVCNWL